MSSCNRRLLLAGMFLAGCGFRPAYGPGGPAERLSGAIRAADPTDRKGFELVKRLEERLGRPAAPRFDLSYDISTSIVGVGITPRNEITRYNIKGRVSYSLKSRETGEVVERGTVANFTSWSATGSTVAALAAEEAAAERLMRILADEIATRLIGSSGRWLG